MLRLILKLAYIVDTLVETLIIVRIILSIFARSSTHFFVDWVKNTSDIFINPFNGIAPTTLVVDNTEIAVTPLIALVFYAILAFVLSELVKAFRND